MSDDPLHEAMREAERLLSGALEPGAIGRPVREFTRGEMADLEMALATLKAARSLRTRADPGDGDMLGALETTVLGVERYKAESASGGTGADVIDTKARPGWSETIARCATLSYARRIATALNAEAASDKERNR